MKPGYPRYMNAERRLARMLSRCMPEPMSGCWLWIGVLDGNFGYGRVDEYGRSRLAHRALYELLRGSVASDLTLDHLCRNPQCVNPAHLDPVSQWVNVMRSPIAPAAINAAKVFCKHGHPLSGANLLLRSDGSRRCATCRKNDTRRRVAAQPNNACGCGRTKKAASTWCLSCSAYERERRRRERGILVEVEPR
jgi:hypothetical protein